MSNACICCGSNEQTSPLPGLNKCSFCGHGWRDGQLSEQEILDLYSSKFFQGVEYLDYEQEAGALSRNFQARLEELAVCAPGPANLYEIGCAYGYFLQLAKSRYSVSGCDISTHAADYARNTFSLKVEDGQYLDFQGPDTPFDIVCMWDTIEHLAEPDCVLAKIERETNEGGIIAASTGDFASLNARMRGRKWRLLQSPSHLHFFTSKSISYLLERRGYEILSIRYPPFWRDADAVAYRVFGRFWWGKWLYNILLNCRLLDFYFPLNTYDLMVVYAKKSLSSRNQSK